MRCRLAARLSGQPIRAAVTAILSKPRKRIPTLRQRPQEPPKRDRSDNEQKIISDRPPNAHTLPRRPALRLPPQLIRRLRRTHLEQTRLPAITPITVPRSTSHSRPGIDADPAPDARQAHPVAETVRQDDAPHVAGAEEEEGGEEAEEAG
ncbi:hypothetical protein LTR66_012113, partial [Elasticomyces elasticus]